MGRVISRLVTQEVNCETGEIINVSSVTTYKKPQITKRYFMQSMDDDWMAKINPIDYYLLGFLLPYENVHQYTIHVNQQVRKKIISTAKISEAQITKSLRSMVEQDVLKRVDRGVYMVNPECIWSGSVKTQEERINKYMSL